MVLRGVIFDYGMVLSGPVNTNIRNALIQASGLPEAQFEPKTAGLRTAILSNMGDSVLTNLEREFAWLGNFDVLVWSYQLGMAKPDPAIYRHTLENLGTRPEETLFVDDKQVNIDAAKALGMVGIEFTTIEKLREDLLAAGLAGALPIPPAS